MKDIKIVFDGDNTTIDLSSKVEGKNLYEQKALVDIVTENGSDDLYEDRGTTLLIDSIRGNVYSKADIVHTGNFAALDTIFFINDTEYADVKSANTGDLISDITIDAISYDNLKNSIAFSVQFTFEDGTSTESIAEIPTVS